ncbi:MAG: SdpI family protein [Firmicutes bacterium]|nr:SdpI family protein [Bacillota bacterium]
MIRRNKGILIITSIIMLIPVVIGLLLWNQLPAQVPSHWGINGEIDGWSSKAFVVFGLPVLLLAIHWVCVIASSADPSSKNYHPKMLTLVLWICPVLSLILNSLVYATALGYSLNIEIIMPLLVGLMFVIVGNLLPKCRQSYTMGIKLPWTLASEENWNKTHRLGGKVWVIGGVLTMATAFLGSFWVLLAVLIIMVAVPTIYSYRYYAKYEKNK